MQTVCLGFVKLNHLRITAESWIRRRPPGLKVSLQPVHFQNVPAGKFVPQRVDGLKVGDVDAVEVALDVLHQHVHSAVIAVDVEFAIPPTGGVSSEPVAEFVDDGVSHQRLVRIRPVQDPIVLGRHAQERNVGVASEWCLCLKSVGLLGEKLRGRAADLNGDLAVEFVGSIRERVHPPWQVGHLHVAHHAWIVYDGIDRGDLDEWQGGFPKHDAGPVVHGC